MMVGMLVAGIGLVLAGLLAIGFGIPVKEFSFGNTLILTGVIGVCTGAIMLGLCDGGPGTAEHRAAARRGVPSRAARSRYGRCFRRACRADRRSGEGGFPFNRTAAESAGGAEPAGIRAATAAMAG